MCCCRAACPKCGGEGVWRCGSGPEHLHTSTPPHLRPISVRMALHTGDVELEDGQYRGLVLHRGSRMLTAAHGGQILCSEATAVLLHLDLPGGVHLMDLGTYR